MGVTLKIFLLTLVLIPQARSAATVDPGVELSPGCLKALSTFTGSYVWNRRILIFTVESYSNHSVMGTYELELTPRTLSIKVNGHSPEEGFSLRAIPLKEPIDLALTSPALAIIEVKTPDGRHVKGEITLQPKAKGEIWVSGNLVVTELRKGPGPERQSFENRIHFGRLLPLVVSSNGDSAP